MIIIAILFLIQTFFNLYLYVVILRLLLQAVRIRFDNSLSQFSFKLTQPVVRPLQKILPEIRGIDLAIVVLILAVEMMKFFLITMIGSGLFPNIGGLFLLSVGDALHHLGNFYFYAIIFKIILSWLMPIHYNPLFFIATQLTEPLLYPIRRLVPFIAGFDLSPLIALFLLQLLEIVFIGTLIQIGSGLV